jgi:hypothetical protein
VPPLEFIEETVVLGEGEDIIDNDSDSSIELTNQETVQITTETPDPETPSTEKAATADDIKLYLLVQRLLNETPLIDG